MAEVICETARAERVVYGGSRGRDEMGEVWIERRTAIW